MPAAKIGCLALYILHKNSCLLYTSGSALGICCQCLVNPFLVVEDVIVRSDQRGKGVGRMLMEALDQFAQEKGCAYSFLVSSDFRTGAHSFYESMGYTDGVVGFRKIYNK